MLLAHDKNKTSSKTEISLLNLKLADLVLLLINKMLLGNVTFSLDAKAVFLS